MASRAVSTLLRSPFSSALRSSAPAFTSRSTVAGSVRATAFRISAACVGRRSARTVAASSFLPAFARSRAIASRAATNSAPGSAYSSSIVTPRR